MHCWNVTFAVLAALVVLALAAVNIVYVIEGSDQNSYQRFCLDMDGKALGNVVLKSNERQIAWDLQYINLTGVVTGLSIHGPIPPGQTDGVLTVALCGLDTTFACDLSTASVLVGEIGQTGDGGPLKPIIQAIRAQPSRFLVKIKTSAVMTGEVQDNMSSLCGTP